MGRSQEIGVGHRLGMYKTRTRLGTDGVVASAALRFLYDVRAGFIRIDNLPTPVTVGQSDVLGGGEFEELLHLVRDDSSTVGLVLEIFPEHCPTYAGRHSC